MSAISPLPGFDWSRVKWGGPRDPVTEVCSYCGEPLNEDDDGGTIALRMWNAAGFGCAFCEACQAKWWGMESFHDLEDGDA